MVRATLRPYLAFCCCSASRGRCCRRRGCWRCTATSTPRGSWLLRWVGTTAHAVAGKALLTPKHTHCHEDTFYNVPFAASSPMVVPLPRVLLSYQPLAVPFTLACSATELRRMALRGPRWGRLPFGLMSGPP
ncbi:MAG: hypothetical protein WKG07_43715 [Hymenobacter sp.]